jgi:superfamily II DNA or RNA helicase
MILRPYQLDLINQVKEKFKEEKRIIMCLPTGGGKTVCFCYMLKKTKMKTLILSDRIEILERTKETLNAFNIEAEIISPNHKYNISSQICLGMVETANKRHLNELADFDFIIIDEAHKKSFDKLFNHFNDNAFVLGVTATPLPTEMYTSIVEGVTTQDLINMKYLSTPSCFGVDVDISGVGMSGGDYSVNQLAQRYSQKKIYTGVVENYKRLCLGEKTLLFAPTIKSSIEVCEELKKNGIDSRHLDSTMDISLRKETLEWFKKTNGVLCNVGICTTGFDLPEIQAVILYRATKSLALFLQMIGRGARTTDTKKDFKVLDFGNNFKTHGFWEVDRTWDLVKKDRVKGVTPVKLCEGCSAMNRLSAVTCWHCNKTFKIQSKKIEEVVLKSIVARNKPNETIWEAIKREAKTKEDVELIVIRFGYAKGWMWANRHMLKKYV